MEEIGDIQVYLTKDHNHSKNFERLKEISLTLVDSYYDHTEKLELPHNVIDNILHQTTNLNSVPDQVINSIVKLSLYERHQLANALCEKFGNRNASEILDITQFISFFWLTIKDCLAPTLEDYQTFEDSYYLHIDTFPGIVYRKIKFHQINQAIEALNDPRYQRAKDLNGYPGSRDALMLALDRKIAATQFDKNDYLTLLSELVARTKLSKGHLTRLHRLKITHSLFFEELAFRHPKIKTAVGYEPEIFRTPYL